MLDHINPETIGISWSLFDAIYQNYDNFVQKVKLMADAIGALVDDTRADFIQHIGLWGTAHCRNPTKSRKKRLQDERCDTGQYKPHHPLD